MLGLPYGLSIRKQTKEDAMLWVLLLEIIVGLIIVGIWGMIILSMLTSGSLVWTIVGLVFTVILVVQTVQIIRKYY